MGVGNFNIPHVKKYYWKAKSISDSPYSYIEKKAVSIPLEVEDVEILADRKQVTFYSYFDNTNMDSFFQFYDKDLIPQSTLDFNAITVDRQDDGYYLYYNVKAYFINNYEDDENYQPYFFNLENTATNYSNWYKLVSLRGDYKTNSEGKITSKYMIVKAKPIEIQYHPENEKIISSYNENEYQIGDIVTLNGKEYEIIETI